MFVILRWSVGHGILLESFANLLGFMDRMQTDPGVTAALLVEEGANA